LVPVGVTRYPPRFPLAYSLKTNLLDLAPTAAMLKAAKGGTLTPKQFDVLYIKQLEAVGIQRILSDLRRLQGRRRGVALLCYEDVHAGQTCHRRSLAAWLQRKAGIKVDEFNGNILVQHHIEEGVTRARPVALGYVRRSHESTERTVSLAAQRAAITRYAAEQGWDLVDVISHDGVSGGKRTRFDAIDVALKQHGAKVVIVYAMDRAGRDVVGLLSWLERAQRAGVQLHAVGKGLVETRAASGFLINAVEAAVAEHLRRNAGERTAAALRHLREKGRRWTRTAPYGFTWTPDGRCVVDPVEAAMIAKARTLRADGATLWKISERLASEGMLSRVGTPLGAKTVRAFLLRRP